MIERVLLGPNPITGWGSAFPEEFAYGIEGDRGTFSQCDFEKRRLGGCWQGKAVVHHDPVYLAWLLNNVLGMDLTMTGWRGARIFRGMVVGARLYLGSGSSKYVTLDTAANAIWVRFRDASINDQFTKSAVASNADSQARFGQKDFPLQGGRAPNKTIADSVARRVLRRKAWPKPYIENIGVASRTEAVDVVRLELLIDGYVKMLKWRVYNQTSVVSVTNMDLEIATILTAVGQYVRTPFYLQPSQTAMRTDFDADQPALDIITGGVSGGDPYDQTWTFYQDMDLHPHLEPWTPPEAMSL